jgi:aspartyl-tRNA synthetase
MIRTNTCGELNASFESKKVILQGWVDTIRDVIAFPKNKSAVSLMDDSPSGVSEKQLKELHVELNLPKVEEMK